MRGVVAPDVAALMEHRGLSVAAAAELVVRDRLPGRGGIIAVDRHGNCVLAYNTVAMYRAWVDARGVIHTAIYETNRAWPARSA